MKKLLAVSAAFVGILGLSVARAETEVLIVPLKSLASACGLEIICTGETVMIAGDGMSLEGNSDRTLTGTVESVFENGWAKVSVNSGRGQLERTFDVSKLSKQVECVRGTCMGDSVIIAGDGMSLEGNSDRTLTGTVEQIFANGWVKVAVNSGRGTLMRTFVVEKLCKETSCAVKL